MSNNGENIYFSLQETSSKENSKEPVTYEELVKEVDIMEMTNIIGIDDYIALEVDYQTNYLKKDLERIADYYKYLRGKKEKTS